MPKRPRITSVYHDQLPEFDAEHRKRYFYLESAFQHLILKSVRGNHNKVLIIVAFGYFKATAQFFDKAHDKDIAYVAIRLNVDPKTIRWEDYNRQTFANHRQLILDYLSFRPFDPSAKTEVIEKLERLARTQASYSSCFHSVVELLQKGKIEIPSYRKIDSLIKSTYQQHEYKLIQSVATLLSANDKHLFDELLRKSATGADVWSKYRITLLKRFSQSVKPGKIKENVAAFDTLKPLFDIANPIVEQLDLTIEGVRHYANSVNKSQVFQVKRRSDPQRYLQLATFVAHQFYRLQDILIESLIVTVTRALNEAEQKAKDELYQQRVRQSQNASALVNDSENLLDILEHVKQALTNANLTDDEKIQKALKYLQPKRVAIETVANNIAAVQEDIEQMSGEALYYRFLEEGSLKLQTRCNDIVKRLHFLPDSANKALIKAVNRLQKTEGTVDTKSPVSFLTRAELSYVDTKEKFRSSLYKVLLFKHIVSAIKGDSLSLLDSYRFRNLDAYLIPTTKWQSHRDTLLRQAEMSAYANVDEVLDECAAENHRQFQETNVHIATDQNGYVQSDGLGGYKLLSERNTSKEALAIEAESVELYPNDNLVSLSEVLNTVNTATGYLDEFHHHQQRYLKDRPETKLFIAATQGIACHLGTPRMIKASKSLGDATTTLETVANHYFHLEAARKASDRIVEYTAKLPVSSLIKSDFGTQTSSDGQKWTVAHDSLNANYSFKYGGKDMVISAYSFIDYRNLFFHSEVISGSEREAHYMIDGVLRNRVVKSDMHSTDTHGYTEAVFGTAHLLNISFAPRMRNVPKQHLYAFKPRRTYAQLDYTILPKGRINIKLIKRHWDEILRLLVSIKLGETSASQVFKRLNSYAKDDNPLYLALKEFGRIPKTLYLYVIWNCCRTMIFANSRDRLVALA